MLKPLDEIIDEEAVEPLPKILIKPGELARAIDDLQKAILKAQQPVLVRANRLMQPLYSKYPTSQAGVETQVTTMKVITAPNLGYMVNKHAAVFVKKNKKGIETEIDPPFPVLNGLLDLGHWSFRRCTGVINNPTLRPNGTILNEEGHDKATGLWFWRDKDLNLEIKDRPTRDDAVEALALLKDLFSEVAFVEALDRSVTLAAVLTAICRGAFEVAPMFLFRAHAAGSGKSYIVDVITHIATGRWCPVIAATGTSEEIEKRLGSLLLEGIPIVSLDNLTRDLQGELLCQMTERPIVKVRILGKSEAPEIEWRGVLFATGNNVGLAGDMTRRGLVANIDPLCEKPEQKTFSKNPIAMVLADRGKYIAAALTIARAYILSGKVKCEPFGSYDRWSRFVREPLIWLGEEDPIKCLEQSRAEDPIRIAAQTLVEQWAAHLGTEKSYKVGEIIDCATGGGGMGLTRPEFYALLVEQAGSRRRDEVVDGKRLGYWLRSIKGQIHRGHRVIAVRESEGHGNFWKLEKV